jgi:tRNA-dihydrouridine synthase B
MAIRVESAPLPNNSRNNLIVAPMAGVTDRPFRQLCKRLGAGMAVSEMVTSNSLLYGSAKTRRRPTTRARSSRSRVQIAGADPAMMAEAARYNVDNGAQIIDINMGCPAKKVCNVMAGSALLQDEPLVGRILGVVRPCPRPGHPEDPHRLGQGHIERPEHPAHRPGVRHPGPGHPRPHPRLRLHGEAEYDTIAAVKAEARIPVIANGDITTPEKAQHVLDYTGADAVMIGRAAQGRPWLFREIGHFLATGEKLAGAGSQRNPRGAAGPSGRPLPFLRRTSRGAHGAQAHRLVHPGPGRFRWFPPCHEPA